MLKYLAGAALAVLLVLNIAWSFRSNKGLLDWGSFVHAGVSYRAGLNPYAENPLIFPPALKRAVNLNPPFSVYLFSRLSPHSTSAQMAFVSAGSLVLFAGVLTALLIEYPDKRGALTILLALNFAGLWHVVEYGQIYMPLFALATAAWLLMKRGSDRDLVLAGLLVGVIVAVKPNFVVWPALLFLAGYRWPAFASLTVAGAISAIPIAVDGLTLYRQWVEVVLAFPGLEWPGNMSLMSLTSRAHLLPVGVLLALCAAGWTALWASKGRDARAVSSAGIGLALLLGPVSWAGYALMLLPVLFSMTWTRLTWTAMALFCVPFFIVMRLSTSQLDHPFLQYVFFGGMYSIALLLLAVEWWTLNRDHEAARVAVPTFAPEVSVA